MFCPVCCDPISTKRKKQIKHLYTHSSEELAQTLLHLDQELRIYRLTGEQRQEQTSDTIHPAFAPYTVDLAAPLAPPPDVFSLVEVGPETGSEDSEEDSDEAMRAAGMEQCAHCGLWVWPDDMSYHLDNTCPELYQGEPDESAVHRPDPGDYQPDPGALSLADFPADYAEVEYIRIPADGPEATLLNALRVYIHKSRDNG